MAPTDESDGVIRREDAEIARLEPVPEREPYNIFRRSPYRGRSPLDEGPSLGALLVPTFALLALAVVLLARSCKPEPTPAVPAPPPVAAAPPAPVAATPEPVTFVDKYVLFDTDKAVVTASAQKYVDEAAAELKAHPDATATLLGTTDTTGSAAHNQALSEARVAAVQAALVAAGVDAKRFVPQAAGASVSKSTNDTEEGKQRNRSVDIHISEPAAATASQPAPSTSAPSASAAPAAPAATPVP